MLHSLLAALTMFAGFVLLAGAFLLPVAGATMGLASIACFAFATCIGVWRLVDLLDDYLRSVP